MRLPKDGKLSRGCGIVSAVEKYCGSFGQPLQPPGPSDTADTANDCIVADRKPAHGKKTCSSGCGERVTHLKSAGERNVERQDCGGPRRGCGDAIASGRRTDRFDAPRRVNLHKPRIQFGGAPRDHRPRLRLLRRADDPSSRFYNSCLLGGYFADRVPEKILVVEVN